MTMRKLLLLFAIIFFSCGNTEGEKKYLVTSLTTPNGLEVPIWLQYIGYYKREPSYNPFGLNFIVVDSLEKKTGDEKYVQSKISESAFNFIKKGELITFLEMENDGIFGALVSCINSAVVCMQEDNLACNCDYIEFPL